MVSRASLNIRLEEPAFDIEMRAWLAFLLSGVLVWRVEVACVQCMKLLQIASRRRERPLIYKRPREGLFDAGQCGVLRCFYLRIL